MDSREASGGLTTLSLTISGVRTAFQWPLCGSKFTCGETSRRAFDHGSTGANGSPRVAPIAWEIVVLTLFTAPDVNSRAVSPFHY